MRSSLLGFEGDIILSRNALRIKDSLLEMGSGFAVRAIGAKHKEHPVNKEIFDA
jgi:hypothetical protein